MCLAATRALPHAQVATTAPLEPGGWVDAERVLSSTRETCLLRFRGCVLYNIFGCKIATLEIIACISDESPLCYFSR